MMAGPLEGIVAAGILEGTGVGPVGAGSGWSSLTAWLVAAAAITVLAGAAWWIAGPSRRRSRRGSAQVPRFSPGLSPNPTPNSSGAKSIGARPLGSADPRAGIEQQTHPRCPANARAGPLAQSA